MQIMNNYFRARASMVYMMTNNEVMNQIIAFYKDMNGLLTFMASYPTYGKGTGTKEVSTALRNDGIDPLQSQGSLTLSSDGRFLFAVNAGSNSISSFMVTENGRLIFADVEPSGGAQPNSIGVFGNLLYVSNVGDAANHFASNISGFYIEENGHLLPIPGSNRSLSTINAQPAQVLFTPNGSKIIIPELTTNYLSIFNVNKNGTVTGPMINESNGNMPFGSYFLSSGLLLVTEVGSNALSSYSLSDNGILHVISGSIPTGQKATCWVTASKNERFAYATNTFSGTITIYRISGSGALTVAGHNSSTPAGTPTGLPMNIEVSQDGRYLYTLNGNQGTVSVFNIQDDGSLVRLQVAAWTNFPYFGSQGLAVL
ncbi:lactonase family protein [Peribacillus butanolivorans]|uniref:lactonase family protein n=1 Tax=Peribacillus butanolivorans TaxID=421767 RepID=UPI0030C9BF73